MSVNHLRGYPCTVMALLLFSNHVQSLSDANQSSQNLCHNIVHIIIVHSTITVEFKTATTRYLTMNSNPNDTSIGGSGGAGVINMADSAASLFFTIPNSKPRPPQPTNVQTYVYKDYANCEPETLVESGTCHDRVLSKNLQTQKLPSKLAAMLQDPGEFVFVV